MTRPGHIANTLSKEGIVATNDGPNPALTPSGAKPVSRLGASRVDPGQWQPIETAPKDGSAIWAATPYSGHGTGFMEPVRTRRHFYGEWQNIYSEHSIDWQPTHWQPLPKPPTQSTEDETQ